MTPSLLEQATDGDLLQAFITRRDEAAFAQIERRHGASVLCACRRALGRTPDAEDAAQLAFISLAKKASSLVGEASVAAWLHHVAWCACIDLKRQSATRAKHERDVMATSTPIHTDDQDGESARVAAVFDDALESVPEKFRVPVILHHLQNHGHDEGAQAMGCKVGTFASRLSRGRDMLRTALRKRGVALSVMALTAFLAQQASASELPPPVPVSDPASLAQLLATTPLPTGAGTATGGSGALVLTAGIALVGILIATAAMLITHRPADHEAALPAPRASVRAVPVADAGHIPPARTLPEIVPAAEPAVAPKVPTTPAPPDRRREPETSEANYIYAGISEETRMPMLRSDQGLISINTLDESILSINRQPARFADLVAGESIRVRWQITPPDRRAISLRVERPKSEIPEKVVHPDF